MNAYRLAALGLTAIALAPAAYADAPAYTIIDLGVVANGVDSDAHGVSPDGNIVVGSSYTSNNQLAAYSWTAQGGMVALPNLSGRKYAVAYDANSTGTVVGVSSSTLFGSSPLPVVWNNGVATALKLPSGYTVGQAYSVNAGGVVAGAVGSGIGQRAALYTGGVGSVITATTSNGSFMTVAFGINDAGLVVGTGTDPSNAAVNVGMVYNSVTGTMVSVGAIPAANGALNFGVSNSGYVVGTSMFNQGSGLPFIWSAANGITALPLPSGTSEGDARGVNDQGWVVGDASSAYSVPYLYADGTTYRLQSLLSAGSGWDLSTNTSASALAITNNGSIIGTALHNGQTHAYEMVLISSVPEPGSWALMLAGLGISAAAVRRRRSQGAA